MFTSKIYVFYPPPFIPTPPIIDFQNISTPPPPTHPPTPDYSVL